MQLQMDTAAAEIAAFVPSRTSEESSAHWMQLLANPRVRVNAIAVDGVTVGYVGSFFSDSEREVTYWLDRRYWGQGITPAALEAFLGDEITRPVVARVARDNARSVRVLEKCGFVLVGQATGYAPRRGAVIEELVFRLD